MRTCDGVLKKLFFISIITDKVRALILMQFALLTKVAKLV